MCVMSCCQMSLRQLKGRLPLPDHAASPTGEKLGPNTSAPSFSATGLINGDQMFRILEVLTEEDATW